MCPRRGCRLPPEELLVSLPNEAEGTTLTVIFDAIYPHITLRSIFGEGHLLKQRPEHIRPDLVPSSWALGYHDEQSKGLFIDDSGIPTQPVA